MILSKDSCDSEYNIQSYEPGCITINGQPYHSPLLITPHTLQTDWGPASFQDLTPQHITAVLETQPTMILIGAGDHHTMLPLSLENICLAQQVPVDCMQTSAACRTYAALASEGRQITAILFP